MLFLEAIRRGENIRALRSPESVNSMVTGSAYSLRDRVSFLVGLKFFAASEQLENTDDRVINKLIPNTESAMGVYLFWDIMVGVGWGKTMISRIYVVGTKHRPVARRW